MFTCLLDLPVSSLNSFCHETEAYPPGTPLAKQQPGEFGKPQPQASLALERPRLTSRYPPSLTLPGSYLTLTFVPYSAGNGKKETCQAFPTWQPGLPLLTHPYTRAHQGTFPAILTGTWGPKP